MLAVPNVETLGLDGVPLLGALAALAIIDSMSFGTLLIPIWLMLAPGPLRAGRMLVYLATIVLFYFGIGLLIALGASAFLGEITAVLETPPAIWVQLLLGAGMLMLSFTISPQKGTEPGRLTRWRARAMGIDGTANEEHNLAAHPQEPMSMARSGLSPSLPTSARSTTPHSAHFALVGLALTAAAIEVASMLPYLAGIGLISTSSAGWPGSALLIAGYCLVMVTPALLLLAARLLAASAVEPLLQKLGAWLAKHAAESTSWIIGIIGFLLARDAATRLGLFGLVGG